MKKIRIVSLVLLLISVFVSVDLGLNFSYNLLSEFHDGLQVNSLLHFFFRVFGDSLWSMERFFNAFEASLWISFVVFVENIILAIVDCSKKK